MSDRDAELLRSCLTYNPETGLFFWLISPSNSVKAGSPAGCTDKQGYVCIRFNNKKQSAHRLAWLYVHGELPKHCVDHINGDRGDNRISNLRDVTPSVNLQNQKKATARNTRGLLGACWNKSVNKWQSQIVVKGKFKYLGIFDTPELAHQAYLTAKRELHEGCTL